MCSKLAATFDQPPFDVQRRSNHLEVAESVSAELSVRVVHYLVSVTAEQAAEIGPPDYWDLVWRTAVGIEYNYQLAITRGPVTRNQQRRFACKLRSVFALVKMHGDPAVTSPPAAVDT